MRGVASFGEDEDNKERVINQGQEDQGDKILS